MIPTNEILMIMSGAVAGILAIWNTIQGGRIKELELKYNNLCSECLYDFTPKQTKRKEKEIFQSSL